MESRLSTGGDLLRGFGKHDDPRADPGIYSHALWIGGIVDDSIRIAGAQWWWLSEFFPGPLDDAGMPPDDCSDYDRIWMVSQDDIQALGSGGPASRDLAEWPWQIGAEVRDGDGVANNYNLDGGDRPRMFGDAMAFWILNDRGNEHLWAQTAPIGLEVKVSAFAYARDTGALSETMFFRHVLSYRGDEPMDSTYVGLWSDLDIELNHVGSDTTLNMAYGYDYNETHSVYDGQPPAVGVILLQGPVIDDLGAADTLRMTNFMETKVTDDGPRHGTTDAYHLLRSYWVDSWIELQPATFGGLGLSGDTPTKILFPGDPITGSYWSMENIDGEGHPCRCGPDKRLLPSSGPFTMQPGDTQEIVYAVTWAQGSDRLDSVRRLREHAEEIWGTYRAIATDKQDEGLTIPTTVSLVGSYPNPFEASTSIQYALPKGTHVTVVVFDALGRQVTTLLNEFQPSGDHRVRLDGGHLSSGTYFVRLLAGGHSAKTIPVVRR